MNIDAYMRVQKMLKAFEHNKTIATDRQDVQEVFKLATKYLREHGIVRFMDDGIPVVNDVGMVRIVIDTFKQDNELLEPFADIKVIKLSGEDRWKVSAIRYTPDGTLEYNVVYSLRYLRERNNFKYELS